MFEQDYLNHVSLPAKLYDKIESDVADLFMDLNNFSTLLMMWEISYVNFPTAPNLIR